MTLCQVKCQVLSSTPNEGPLTSLATGSAKLDLFIKSGCFDSVTFEQWFTKIFFPSTRHLKPQLLLIGDNLSSHFSPSVIQLARDLNI